MLTGGNRPAGSQSLLNKVVVPRDIPWPTAVDGEVGVRAPLRNQPFRRCFFHDPTSSVQALFVRWSFL